MKLLCTIFISWMDKKQVNISVLDFVNWEDIRLFIKSKAISRHHSWIVCLSKVERTHPISKGPVHLRTAIM